MPVTAYRYIKSQAEYDSDFADDKRHLSSINGIHLEFRVTPNNEGKIIELDRATRKNPDWKQYYTGADSEFIIAQTIDWDEPLYACNDIQPNRRAKVLEPRGSRYVIGPRDKDSYFEIGFRRHIANTIRKFMVTTNMHIFEKNFCPESINIYNGWHESSERSFGWISG